MAIKQESWYDLLRLHLQRYPLMEPRDVYKLFYQGIMGSEHFIASAEEFSQQLTLEFNHLVPNPAECITEPVRPDQSLLRLNLRAYKTQRQQVDLLLPCLLDTARSVKGDRRELRSTWMGFIDATRQGMFPGFDLMEIDRLTSLVESQEYPAVSHSKVYRQQYQPAYRLIAPEYIEELELRDDC